MYTSTSVPPESERITAVPSSEEQAAIQGFESTIKTDGEFQARIDNISRQTAATVKMPVVKRKYNIVMGVRVPVDMPRDNFR